MRTLVILTGFLVACAPGARDDEMGMGNGSGSGSGSGIGTGTDGCSDAAKLVYVLDENNKFSAFDPASKTFMDIGTLACPTLGSDTYPFSMSVDRDAIAGVLYSSGELFRVDTSNLSCTKPTWAPRQDLMEFGMGFSTDSVGGTTDTLYIAGGRSLMNERATLAKVSTSTFAVTQVGQVAGWPELTGNGNAELWGWFPSDAEGVITPRIEQIDKASGNALTTYMLPTLKGPTYAWAFAFWGGDYWIFLAKRGETTSNVYQIDGTNGTIKSGTPVPGHVIVGAGVSTCAPVVLL